MTIDAPLDVRPAAVPPSAVNGLLVAPILPTLLKLAVPNTIAIFGTTLVAVAETSYIGRLGTEPLAAIALVFPFAMLTQMMSAGAMGGGVSSAISRALGAGNRDRAASLALHAAMIGACGALGLGLAGLPQLGMRGVAAGQLAAFSLGAIFLSWYLISGRSRLTQNFS